MFCNKQSKYQAEREPRQAAPIHRVILPMFEVIPMNKQQIQCLLAGNNRAVELAILGLFDRQTVGEQRTSSTSESNGRGFCLNDAAYGSYLGRWLKSGRHLTGTHLGRARRMATHYWRQVAEMSNVCQLLVPPPLVVRGIYTPQAMATYIKNLDPFQSEGHAKGWIESRA
jgi:hypothetical protein